MWSLYVFRKKLLDEMSKMFETKAYHQSGLKNAEKSLNWQSFFVSDHENLWLGKGIYFWERYQDACWWDGGYIHPVVLSVDLKCEEDLFLNLDNRNQKKAFIDYMANVIEQAKKNGCDILSPTDDIIAGGSCNYYKNKFRTKLIKYSFPEVNGKPQFCATDSSVTRNVKMVSFDQNGIFMEVQNEFF